MNNVINTKVEIFRNLKDYKFVPKLENDKKEEIVSIITKNLPEFSLCHVNNLDENTKKYLLDNQLILMSTANVFLNKSNSISVKLFETEHLSICATGKGFDKTIFESARLIAKSMDNKINFSYADNYGYLMSDIKNLGSGIRIESLIALEGLFQMNKIEQVKQNLQKLGYNLTNTKFDGLYVLQRNCNLGLNEDEIYIDFEKTINQLAELEMESTKMLDISNHDQILDRAKRSEAILGSAYLMNVDELLKLVMALRIGINLNLIDVKAEVINELTSMCLNKNIEIVSQSELKTLAETVRKIIKGEANV